MPASVATASSGSLSKNSVSKPTEVADYIEIARAFNTVLLSGVPLMDENNADATRRFINLIDEFYDRNVKMLISAASPSTISTTASAWPSSFSAPPAV